MKAIMWVMLFAIVGTCRALFASELTPAYSNLFEDKVYQSGYNILTRLAESGDLDALEAQTYIGLMYYKGLGIAQSSTTAKQWWEKAAASGHAAAQGLLGMLFLSEDDGLYDQEKGIASLSDAAELGFEPAEIALAKLYLVGTKVKRDLPRAYFLLRSALLIGSDTDSAAEAFRVLRLFPYNTGASEFTEIIRQSREYLLSFEKQESGKVPSVLPGMSDVTLYFNNRRMLGLLREQKYVPYDPRAQGKDLVSAFEQSKAIGRDNPSVPVAAFLLQPNTVGAAHPEAIKLDPAGLWGEIRPGDILVISDKITHHAVTAFKIDRKSEKVLLIDPWPDNTFLRKGLNLADVSAKVVDYKYGIRLVEISRDEFSRIALGIIAFRDRPNGNTLSGQLFLEADRQADEIDRKFADTRGALDAKEKALLIEGNRAIIAKLESASGFLDYETRVRLARLYAINGYLGDESSKTKAEFNYESAIAIKPEDIKLHISVGHFFLSLSQPEPELAAKHFLIARSFAGNEPLSYANYGLAAAYLLLGKIDDAESEVNTALRQLPENENLISLKKQILSAKNRKATSSRQPSREPGSR